MNFSEIKELIELINGSNLAYFELNNEKDYIKIDKSMTRDYLNISESRDIKSLNTTSKDKIVDVVNVDDTLKEANISTTNEINEDEDFEYIVSPIVGTYYQAISPTSDPFVEINQKVKKGQVVCIVEAMKLMNEIVADFDCEIIDILCQDGKMVEYSQPLLKVRRL